MGGGIGSAPARPRGGQRAMRIWTQLVAGAAIAAVGWAMYSGALPGFATTDASTPAGGDPGGGRPATPIVTEPIREGSTQNDLRAIGTGTATRSVTLVARSAGLVEEIPVSAGERVEPGQTVVRLDADDERIALEQARSIREATDATLGRYERLAQSGNTTQSQVDDARAAARAAAADLEMAQLALDRRTVAAPFGGIVGIPKVAQGDLVSNSTELITVDDRTAIRVDFEIPERHIGSIEVGMPVRARTPSDAGVAASGEIVAIDSRVDPVSRTIAVRAELDNADDRLRPGMSFDVTVGLSTRSGLIIPPMAIQLDRDGAYFWTDRDGVAARVDARILQRLDDSIIVDADIAVGAPVIVQGFQGIRAGTAVRHVEPANAG